MAQADPQENSIIRETLEGAEESLGPSLNFEGAGNGYVRAEEIDYSSGVFSRPVSSLEEYDSLTDENIVINPQRSAMVLEHYFGQHSRSDDSLEEVLDQFDIEPPSLDNNIVMELDLNEYDGKQHVKYHEGEVAKDLVEYLDSKSSWSSQTYFMEESEKLFIQSSP